MNFRGVATTITNFTFLAYVCGASYLGGCSTQIILKDRIISRRKNGKCRESKVLSISVRLNQ